MRLWIKLAVMVGLAAGAQWCVDQHAAALDDAWFTLRCGARALHGEEDPSADAMAAADRLRERQMERLVAELAAAR